MIHVIIPVYNAKQFLRAAVDSVLNQPCKDIDIVLVNDGSTDGSDLLCDEIAAQEERVSVIHQKNSGVSVARNTGIEAVLQAVSSERSENHYVAFLDADDLWYPNTLSTALSTTLSSSAGDSLIALGTISCNHSATRFAYNNQYASSHTQEGFRSIWMVGGHLGSCLYPVCLLRDYFIRFIAGLRYAEDKIFQMQCVFLSSNVCFLPTTLYIYRENDTSAMKKVSNMTAIEYLLPIIDGWIISDAFVNRYQPVTGRELRAGRILAGIYFMEMAADHYKQWGKKADLLSVFQTHPHAYLLEQMRLRDVSETQYKNRTLLLNHHWLFKVKYNLIGIKFIFARLIKRIPPVQQWWLQRKYPLTELPANLHKM